MITVPRKASRRFKAASRLLCCCSDNAGNGFAVMGNGYFLALLHLCKVVRQVLAKFGHIN